MCKAAMSEWPRDMTLSTFERARELLFPSALRVELRGRGESTISPLWAHLLTSLSKDDELPQMSLTTNGQQLTASTVRWLIKFNCHVSFSIDGADRGVFEHVRRGLCFDTVVSNIEEVIEKRKAAGLDLDCISMVVTVQRANYMHLEALVDLAAIWGIGSILFHDIETRNASLMPPHDAMSSVYAKAIARAAYRDVAIVIPYMYTDTCGLCIANSGLCACQECLYAPAVFPDASIDHRSRCAQPKPCAISPIRPDCTAPWTTAFVAADGVFGLCCKAIGSCGNIMDDDLDALWLHPRAEGIRKALALHSTYEECHGCLFKGTRRGVRQGLQEAGPQ